MSSEIRVHGVLLRIASEQPNYRYGFLITKNAKQNDKLTQHLSKTTQKHFDVARLTTVELFFYFFFL